MDTEKKVNSSANISFFDRMRRFARDVDTKMMQLEALIHTEYNDSATGSAVDEAMRVINEVATEVKYLKDSCQDTLNQIQYNGEQLRRIVNSTRLVVEKQGTLAQFYCDHLNKYGYMEPDEDKENITKKSKLIHDGGDSEMGIKSGFTSVLVNVKDLMPGDFCHQGLLVTPGLFPSEKKYVYFCSPTTEKQQNVTCALSAKQQPNMNIPEPPPILSSKYALNHLIKIPDEPPLLSRQINTKHSSQKANFHQLDLMTPLPPSPVMMSKLIDRKSAHGIKKINLDDGEDNDDPTEPSAFINSKLYQQGSGNVLNQTLIIAAHGKQQENAGAVVSPSGINDTTIFKSSLSKDSETVYGNGDRSTQLERIEFLALPPSPPMLSRKKVTVKGVDSQSSFMDTAVGGASCQNDSKPAADTMAVPLLHTVLSRKPDNTNMIRTLGESPLDQPDLASFNPEIKPMESELVVRLVRPEEFGNLPEALTRVVSLERMNRCVDRINCYLREKSQTELSFHDLRDNLGFGIHAKDVIVFMIKLGRLSIHKRCSHNPLYKIL